MQTDEIERLFLPINRESLDAFTPPAGASACPLTPEVGCMSDVLMRSTAADESGESRASFSNAFSANRHHQRLAPENASTPQTDLPDCLVRLQVVDVHREEDASR